LIRKSVQREHHSVPILAVVLAQVTEFDQLVDKRFRQIDGDATRPSWRRRSNRYIRGSPANAIADMAVRRPCSAARFQPMLRHTVRLIDRR
jgi:hypothetical protein